MGILSRRRKIILVCAALGIGGYASYRVYKSSYVSRKRQRLGKFMASLASLVEAFAEGIDSTSLVTSDVKTFLQSDADEVPRSLRQCLKIMRCREFQDAVTSFSTGVSRGVVGSIVVESSQTDRASSSNASRRRILHCTGNNEENEWEKHVLAEEPRIITKGRPEGLPERLLQTLFSDAGKGFASVVLGNVAKNTTLSLLEGLNRMKQPENMTSEWDSRGLAPDVCNLQETTSSSFGEKLLDLASSSKGRSLLGECIQAFVGTAVSVYLDKTKDVNMYEDLVAGMTKPSHQPAVKELLTMVCNGAVETLVKTSHEVLSRPENILRVSTPLEEQEKLGEENILKLSTEQEKPGQTSAQDDGSSSGGSVTDTSDSVSKMDEASSKTMIFFGSSKKGLPNWVDGVSRTLAVPSNRRLLIEVAGTVTSEAIRSFFDMFLGIVSRGNFKYTRKFEADEQQLVGRHSMERWILVVSRELIARSLVIMTVCLAVVMHVVLDEPWNQFSR